MSCSQLSGILWFFALLCCNSIIRTVLRLHWEQVNEVSILWFKLELQGALSVGKQGQLIGLGKERS